jgi:putative membrane protein
MNTNTISPSKLKRVKSLILIASIAIPLVVALLFGIKIDGYDFSFLPSIYAAINGTTAVLLVAALLAIKSKNRVAHERLMKISIFLSLIFLVLYIVYHITSNSTLYGDLNHNGNIEMDELKKISSTKFIYYFILISHIFLSVAVVPMVLYTYFYSWQRDFVRHKKWARFTWPIWFYVAVTGVVVYFMISPYYG